MATNKPFDCAQMKWDIQRRILKEYAGLSAEERREAMRRRIEEHPILGPYLRHVRVINQPIPDGAQR